MTERRKATKEDYIRVQGGEPEVSRNGETVVVHHKFRDETGRILTVDVNVPASFAKVPFEAYSIKTGERVIYEAHKLWGLTQGAKERGGTSL